MLTNVYLQSNLMSVVLVLVLWVLLRFI